MARRADLIRDWRDRWSGVDRTVVRGIADDLLHGRPVATAPFEPVGGRTDLRGFPLTRMATGGSSGPRRGQIGADDHATAAATPPPRWSGLDLTGADLSEFGWFDLTVEHCVLDDAELQGLRCWGVTIVDTSLRAANLHHGQLGAPAEFWPRRSTWTRVDLTRADLRGTTAEVTFTAVDFANARFTGTNFNWSDLVDCTFAGVVRGLHLGRRPVCDQPETWQLTGVDLRAARPRGLELTGVNLGTSAVDLRLPDDEAHWTIPDWPAYLERVRSRIRPLPEGDVRMVATIWEEYARKDSGPTQRTGFIATWDTDDLGGPALTDLLRAARA
ncbi:pentapeptide repeat-containing protein [Dactylosporangium sp. NPDC051541]|uniref:pentapeptide repeat-containing protein n=1 Tax=Dactylosporangium sp. NPDC051541 TaxID=3363977 RepID=UPI00378F6839